MRMSNSGQEGGGKQNKRTDYKFKMHIVAPVKNKQTYSPRNTYIRQCTDTEINKCFCSVSVRESVCHKCS